MSPPKWTRRVSARRLTNRSSRNCPPRPYPDKRPRYRFRPLSRSWPNRKPMRTGRAARRGFRKQSTSWPRGNVRGNLAERWCSSSRTVVYNTNMPTPKISIEDFNAKLDKASDIDFARLAAYIDGEGCIGISNSKRRGKATHRMHTMQLTVTNTSLLLLDWITLTFGGSAIPAN